ncbi:MAG: hypothetical protein HC806_02470 [Anaerolineae bacterium]|nr:hypothetical protein [Anaerolineae bacterium]
MIIPTMLLRRLYTFGSLENTSDGVKFSVKNRLSDATLTGITFVKIDGQEVPFSALHYDLGDGDIRTPDQITSKNPIDFPLRKIVKNHCQNRAPPKRKA